MQSAMAAQTVAFKMPVKDTSPVVDTAVAAPPGTALEIPPVVDAPVSEAPAPFVAGVSDMDATRRYEPAAVEGVREPEAAPANIESAPVEENISQPTTDDEFLTVEKSGLAAGALDPYATVMTDPAAPGAAAQTPHTVAAPPIRKVTVPADAPAAPAGRSVAPAKKSSKKGLLVGGLAALFLLIAAGGAGGWFVYQKYYAAAAPTPSPSPVATASPSPTVEMPVGTNTLDNSNTAIPDVNSNKGTNTLTEGTPKPAVKATPARTPPPAKTPPPRLKTEL
jgi:hypothetical protein